MATLLAGFLQLLAAAARPAAFEGKLTGQQPGLQGRGRPPACAQVGGGPFQVRHRHLGSALPGQP